MRLYEFTGLSNPHYIDIDIDESDVIFNQGSLSMTKNINNVDYTFYNSAIFKYEFSGTCYCYAFIMARVPFHVINSGASQSYANVEYADGVYSAQTFISLPIASVSNDAWYIDGTSLGGWDYPYYPLNLPSNIPVFDDLNEFIAYTRNPLVMYNWKSVPSISGKLGAFSLSTIDSDYLNDGNAVTGADGSHIERLCPETRISALGANVPFNVETPVLYAGQVDYMSYTIEGAQVPGQPAVISAFKLKFYMAGSSTPFYTVSLTGSGLSIPDNAYLHFIIDEDNQVARLSIIYRITSTNPITFNYNGESFSSEQQSQMYLWLHSHIPPEEITDSTDNIGNGDEGGDGWQPWNNIPIPRQSKPTKGGLSTGFTSMYKVDETILQDLSNFLWSDNFVNNVKKFFNDPREIIVGLMLFPVAPSASDTPTEIKAGRISTGVSAYKLLDQYLDVDMGVVNMHEETHTFLDFPPNTKASIFLPYCGEHSLDVNEIQGKVLHLKYTFDFLTGAVCAQIEVDGSCVYSFSGQCGVQLPTSSEDFSRMYSSILSAGATLGAALATVASGGLTAPLVSGMGINLLSNGMNMTPNVQSSSGGGGGSGFISNQMPFLKLEIPDPLMANGDTSEEDFESSKQYSFLGKPTYQSLTIGSCSGFTKCLDAHLVNLTGATTQEQDDILRALKDGVLIESGSSTPSDTPAVAGNTVITFLKCTSENNVIGKSWSATTLALEGKLIYNQSITSPKFLVSGNAIGYNYCYIALFGRFYFINDIVCRENGMQEISLSVDVLQSFKAGILNCKAIIERQKTKGNLYMTDAYMWTKAKKKIVTVPFMGGSYQYVNSAGQQNFERANNSYVLTIAGD